MATSSYFSSQVASTLSRAITAVHYPVGIILVRRYHVRAYFPNRLLRAPSSVLFIHAVPSMRVVLGPVSVGRDHGRVIVPLKPGHFCFSPYAALSVLSCAPLVNL